MTDAARRPKLDRETLRRLREMLRQRAAEWKQRAIEVARRLKRFTPGKSEGRAVSPLVVLTAFAVVLFGGVAMIRADVLPLPAPDYSMITHYRPQQSISVYDNAGKLTTVIPAQEDRVFVPLGKISAHMKNAILAAEDKSFFQHSGIDPMGIMRAALTNLQAGRVVEGGSTITQQLVKNLYLHDEPRSFLRKVKEAYMSWKVENNCSKHQILEAYLNEVYFGNNVYGIERAAQRYFGKTAANLSVAESAYLASLVKAPSYMGAAANRKLAVSRQSEIIDNMVAAKFITPEESAAAKKHKLVFIKEPGNFERYPFYVAYLHQLLERQFGADKLFQSGLKVYTALDQKAQQSGERALAQGIKKAPRGVRQGALASVSVKDGAVVALVGGVGDYWKAQWNRATSYHTAGSAFKPFVYLTALLHGAIGPNSIIADEPITIFQKGSAPYSPRNFDGKFRGVMSIRKALALSRNVCAVRVASMVGIKSVIAVARASGIKGRLDPYPSLALGASAVSPLEMAGAYATFARSGTQIDPWLIDRVEDAWGNELYRHKVVRRKVFPDEPCNQLIDMMQDVVTKGTGTRARLPGRPVAGKTGTADQSKDIWFVGCTADLCTALWGGNDENHRIPGSSVTGGGVMAGMWQDYSSEYYKTHKVPVLAFARPKNPINDFVVAEQTEAPDQPSVTPSRLKNFAVRQIFRRHSPPPSEEIIEEVEEVIEETRMM